MHLLRRPCSFDFDVDNGDDHDDADGDDGDDGDHGHRHDDGVLKTIVMMTRSS